MNVNSVDYLSVYQNRHKEKEGKQSLADRRQFILNDLGYHVKFNYNSSPVSLDSCELLMAAAGKTLSQFRYQDTIIMYVCNRLSIKLWYL